MRTMKIRRTSSRSPLCLLLAITISCRTIFSSRARTSGRSSIWMCGGVLSLLLWVASMNSAQRASLSTAALSSDASLLHCGCFALCLDTELKLSGEGFIFIGGWEGSYCIPTETAREVRSMTLVFTRTLVVLLLVAVLVYVPMLALWDSGAGYRCRSRRRRRRRGRKVQWLCLRKWYQGLVTIVPFACSLAAAAYINEGASKAANQVVGNVMYISSPLRKPGFGTRFEGLIAGVVVMELLVFGYFGMWEDGGREGWWE
ncbi:hypothetical protein BDV96DRAFT_585008 [Lophiotrema nucula]|uniref:Uncharacterized protein n=1 Tax=Lophiotrema nucula TaxID=690887 RepID=A0A6A5YTY8_9PLEO|nr:hypothetical protein BDV96DRAFT_585008 [Lophiotrema nucula]